MPITRIQEPRLPPKHDNKTRLPIFRSVDDSDERPIDLWDIAKVLLEGRKRR
jgi:hypothetical protein